MMGGGRGWGKRLEEVGKALGRFGEFGDVGHPLQSFSFVLSLWV